jgi:hypothetical protein
LLVASDRLRRTDFRPAAADAPADLGPGWLLVELAPTGGVDRQS